MSTNPIGAAHADPWARLTEALDAHADALESVQEAANPVNDRVQLSDAALDALRAPAAPTEAAAVADAVIAGHQVEATAAVARADEARFQALVFVLAHHGPPLG